MVQSLRGKDSTVLARRVGAERRFEALLALVDGEPAGLALFFPDFLTWRGGPGLYLGRRPIATVGQALGRRRKAPREGTRGELR